ncbi:hypothetical protein EG028_09080 [Chitinophaga barathri]|uniref:WWE domain-containing protein n=2 Tax=Chitinophaga barathri TaxID=1647451 RepID=A0A3N4MC55_9BACT|nr:hypothetical protein EG028_09080 [Chitinophaga barathri]
MLFISTSSFAAGAYEQPASATVTSSYDWMKSPSGTWEGKVDGKAHWYKLDKKGGLWQSTDGKKWTASKEGLWSDKSGRWLKIHDKKLVWSTDGKEWAEVPEWKWEGSDGKWYKFDTDWTLWVN